MIYSWGALTNIEFVDYAGREYIYKTNYNPQFPAKKATYIRVTIGLDEAEILHADCRWSLKQFKQNIGLCYAAKKKYCECDSITLKTKHY